MPPSSNQGGPGKKNALHRPSRTSTPVPATSTSSSLPPEKNYDPDFLNSRVILFDNLSIDDIVDHGVASATVPDSKAIDAMLDKLKSLASIMEKRSTFYDRGMRFLADERKKRPDDYGEGEYEGKRSKHKRKKASDTLAPNDAGSHKDRSSPLRDSKRKHSRDRESASSSLSPVAQASPGAMEVDQKTKKEEEEESSSSSEDEGAPPRREAPKSFTFGDDPSTFPDPTIYEIRDVHDGMTTAEKAEIYSVAVFPQSDLLHCAPGPPPMKDFSNTKPSSQINYSTFTTYIEPYFRPFSEEDLAFLRERGDHSSPFMMPKRGKRHYTDVWNEEDGNPSKGDQDGPRKTNQPRGNIDNMNDAMGETDNLSIGPLATRLLAAMRPEHRQQTEEKPMTNGFSNGDLGMNGDLGADDPTMSMSMASLFDMPPATFMMESSSDPWKKASHPKLDYAQVDERLKQELKYIGFLAEDNFDADYDEQYDDEVAGRLRELQRRLKEQMLINGARKARLTELVKERLAHQEYQTILEDLDGQVQGAYTKRTRTIGKNKKAKRPGGAGGGSHFVGGAAGMARPGIGDMTRTLMDRRRRWIDLLGTVFNDEVLNKVPQMSDPDSSIFKPREMDVLMAKEKEQWDEEVDEE